MHRTTGKRINILFACLLSGFTFGSLHADDASAPALGIEVVPNPLLALPSPPAVLPLLDAALRDPSVRLPKKESGKARQLLLEQIRQTRGRLLATSKMGNAARLRAHLDALLAYSYLLSDVLTTNPAPPGKRPSESQGALSNVRRQIKSAASRLFRHSRDPYEKATGLFHLASLDFLEPSKRAKAVQLFGKLIHNRHLSEGRLRIARLAVSLHRVEHGSADERQEAQRQLERLYSQLPRRAALLAHLSLARSLRQAPVPGPENAGAGSPDYRQHLMVVSRLCGQLGPYEKSALARSMIGIWTSAPDFAGSWQTLPFKSECFLHDTAMRGVIERQALAAWKAGQLHTARDRYALVVQHTGRESDRRRLEGRLVQVLGLIYEREHDPSAYQQYLIAAERKNRGTPYGKALQNLHVNLVLAEIERSRTSQQPLLVKLSLTVSQYLATQPYDLNGQRIKLELAATYMQSGDYRSAEQLYSELSREVQGEGKKDMLRKQIAAQTPLAGWQLADPWQNLGQSGSKAEREHLLRLYYNLMQAEGSLVWQLSTQIGLLELSLGRKDKAFFLWENALRTFPRQAEGERILALMLRSCEADKRWARLEELAYLGLDLHITPRLQGQDLVLRDKLEVALYEQSKAAISAKHYELAIKKLSLLETTYDESPRHSEYAYTLAAAYRAHQNHNEALATLMKLLKANPAQPYYKEALMDAATIQVGMADPQAALILYERYIAYFPDDSRTDQVRRLAAGIHESLSQYAKAKVLYQSINLAALTPVQRQQISERVFQIEQKLGGDQAVVALAEQALGTTEGPVEVAAPLKARSIAVLARRAYDDNHLAALAKLETLVLQDKSGAQALSDSLSLIWYLRAKLLAEGLVGAFKKVLTANEHDALAFLQASYKQAKGSFLAVCQIESAAYCVPGMQDLLAVNSKVQGFIEDMGQSPESDENSSEAGSKQAQQEHYGTVKAHFLAFLHSDRLELQQRTLSLLGHGNTHPRMTRQVLWQNARDYHLPVNGGANPGFLQLSQDDLHVPKKRQGG